MNHGIRNGSGTWADLARELVGHRVMATDLAGKDPLASRAIQSAMAVDPASGDLWCLVDEGTIDSGELIVLDVRGTRRAHYPICGVDIAYDPHDQTFWVVGKDLVRVDRRGQKLLNIANFAAWTCVSVAPIPGTGEAWLAERRTPSGCGEPRPPSPSRAQRVRSSRASRVRTGIRSASCDPGPARPGLSTWGKPWYASLSARSPAIGYQSRPWPSPSAARAGRSGSRRRTRSFLKYGVAVVRGLVGQAIRSGLVDRFLDRPVASEQPGRRAMRKNCRRQDLNLHALLADQPLKLAGLPIRANSGWGGDFARREVFQSTSEVWDVKGRGG